MGQPDPPQPVQSVSQFERSCLGLLERLICAGARTAYIVVVASSFGAGSRAKSATLELMNTTPTNPKSVAEAELDQCRSYLAYQREHPKRPTAAGVWPPSGPAVTLSSQAGAGADAIAAELARTLQRTEPRGQTPWTVFNRQLVERVIEEHHLPKHLARLMPEDRRSYLEDVLDEFAGLRPPSWDLLPKIIQTVAHLADAGHVILVGRGAAIITWHLANIFHVRLIASLPKRIQRLQSEEQLLPQEATRMVAERDRGRERYLRRHFHVRADDDLQYHLVVNTDLLSTTQAAAVIAAGARIGFAAGSGAEGTRPGNGGELGLAA